MVISLTAGQELTVDMPRLGKDISFGTATKLTLANAVTSYGSLDFTGSGVYTQGANAWTFESQARSGTQTLTNSGIAFGNNTVNLNSVNTNFNFADAFSLNTNGTLVINTSTINVTAIANMTMQTFNLASGTLNMGSGQWSIARTSGTPWTVTGGTINPQTSTIVLSDTGNSAKTFAGGNQSYNNVSITAGGTGAWTITGSNIFNKITVNAPKTLTLTGGTTQNVGQFVANGSAGNIITINSPAGTTVVPVLNKTGGGTIQCNYLKLQGVNVTPANTWYVGNQSTNSSTNVVGYGLNFGGQATGGDYVSAANSATGNQIYGATSFSADVWFVGRSLGAFNQGVILGKYTAAAGSGFVFVYNAGNTIVSGMTETTLKITTTTTTVPFNQLNHIGVSWTSGQAVKIYINGSEASYSGTPGVITTPSYNDSALNMTIGNANSRAMTFDGQQFAVRIYRNVALSTANFATLYAAGCKAHDPLNSATAEYLFNEGTGATLTDSIAGNNGTITGAAWSNIGFLAGLMPNFFMMWNW